MKVLDRLKKTWECNDSGEGNCSCRCCCGGSDCGCQENNENEFVLKENLSDEEIEEIIKTEYGYKDPYSRISIRKALKLFGNMYSYHKTDFRYMKVKDRVVVSADEDKLITVTCFEHGDFTIKRSKFFKVGCPDCFVEEKNNPGLVDSIFKSFLYKDLPNTREYLKKNYITGKKGYATSLIVKEDFITLASNIRDDMYLFDLSYVPDVIIGITSKFLIKFNDPVLNISGDWTTNMEHFIYRKQTPLKLSGKYLGIERSEKIGEIVKSKLEEMYPTLDFSETTYNGMHQPINFRCKIHNIELTYCSAHSMLKDNSVSGFKGCPECLKEYRESLESTPTTKTTEEFIKDCEEVYGVGAFDYSLVNYKRWDIPVEIIDLEYNEVFSVRPSYFLKGKGSPFQYESGGEALVRRSLEKIKEENINDMIIEKEQSVKDKIEGRNTNMVIIDYICYIDSAEIWIEYNGQQHYNSYYYKQFENWESLYEKQLKRDVNIREYCKNNDIMLIEIPYTYNNKDSVYKVLYDILVNNKKPEDLIIIPEIEKI